MQHIRGLLLRASAAAHPPMCPSAARCRAKVDHPGTWEDARHAYLNELLVRRQGHPAALAIMHAEVAQRLLQLGALDFGVTLDVGGYSGRPRAVALPGLSRAVLVQADGSVLNTCSSEVLAELLRWVEGGGHCWWCTYARTGMWGMVCSVAGAGVWAHGLPRAGSSLPACPAQWPACPAQWPALM
jgi:hypothetical protein